LCRSNDLNENVIGDAIKKYGTKLSDKYKDFVTRLKQEGTETKEAYQKLVDSVVNGKDLTKEERKEIGDQLKDVLKLIGFTAASILPGGIIYLLLTRVTALKRHLVPSAFLETKTPNNMIKLKPLIIKEAKANTHLTHLEELILTRGRDGYDLARSFLLELIKNLKGNSNAKVNTTIKWDGAPAIFSGVDPDSGRFFVGTKSVFNKEPKLNFTNEDIERNHGDAPGLVDKLKRALANLPKLGYKHTNQRDGSLFKGYKDSIDPDEARFWMNLAKKEYFFIQDRNITYTT